MTIESVYTHTNLNAICMLMRTKKRAALVAVFFSGSIFGVFFYTSVYMRPKSVCTVDLIVFSAHRSF